MSHSIFLSYASPDRSSVESFYDALLDFGFEPWMDSRKLTAGQNWDFEIQRALDQATIIVVFLSSNSVNRRGYVQREVKLALRKREEKLIDDVFLIPVSLEETERPPELSGIQFLDAKSPSAFEDLQKAIAQQLALLGAERNETRVSDDVLYRIRRFKDVYEGIPGFEINSDYLEIESGKFPAARDAAIFINGHLADLVMSARLGAAEPDPEFFDLSQDAWSRTNTLDLVFGELSTVGRTCSVSYTIHTYGAGAAHPVSGLLTYNFFLSPVTRIGSLKEIFEMPSALDFIQEKCRQRLVEDLREIGGTEPDVNWINKGTDSWDALDRFTFKESHLILHFGSYQVAAYAFGHQTVSIPLVDLAIFMKRRAAISLDVKWQRDRAREALADKASSGVVDQ